MQYKIVYTQKSKLAELLQTKVIDEGDIVFFSDNPGFTFISPEGVPLYPTNHLGIGLPNQEAVDEFIKSHNAFSGELVTLLSGGKYKAYILQPYGDTYILDEIGGDGGSGSGKEIEIVSTLPTENQRENVVYIKVDGQNPITGNMWINGKWERIFDNVSYAPIANPDFIGTVTVNGNLLATEAYVDKLVAGLSQSPGVVDGTTHPFPDKDYKVGMSWRVLVAGTYAGRKCEPGDLILCLNDYTEGSASNDDFMVLQGKIDNSVNSSGNIVLDGSLALFDGTTGRKIKGSDITIDLLNGVIQKAHEHANKDILDTFTKTQEELLSIAAQPEVITEDQIEALFA